MNPEDIAALVARLEAAKEGSRELDWAISEALGAVPAHTVREVGFDYDWYRRAGQWSLWKALDAEGRTTDCWMPRPFTTSLDAALTLIPAGDIWAMDPEEDPVGMYTGRWDAYVNGWSTAATPALALCIAALKARSAS